MKYKVRFSIGLFLAFILVALLTIGILFVVRTRSAVSRITGETVEISRVGVFVRSDDAAQTIKDTAGRSFGVLESLDRDTTNQALSDLTAQLGSDVQAEEYKGLTDLIDGIQREEVGAILLNEGYLDIIQEIDRYSDVRSRIRSVGTLQIRSQIDQKLTDTDQDQEASQQGAAAASAPSQSIDGKVYTIYISGIDTRGEMTTSSRSDVNIIATINLDTHQILLVSTPRDYFIPLSISGGKPDKLMFAGIYGIDVCLKTLSMLYDYDLQYYFRVNFAGFKRIIDALGGVEIFSDYEFDSQNEAGYHFNAGSNYVDGEAALAFSRERYSFESGDRQRGRNQMAVIQAVVDKAVSTEMIRNYSSVLSGLTGCFGTNISYEEIARLLQKQLDSGKGWEIITYSVDGTGDQQAPYSYATGEIVYVMIPDYTTVEKAKSLMAKVRNSERITQEEADAGMAVNTD